DYGLTVAGRYPYVRQRRYSLFSDKEVDHQGITQPPQCNLVTQVAGAKVLLERSQRMLREGDLVVTVRPNKHQLRRRAATCQDGDQVDGRIVDPLEILEHDHERASRRDRLQRVADLPQHPRGGGAQDFAPQKFATVWGEQGGKLDEPGGSLGRQDLDDRV